MRYSIAVSFCNMSVTDANSRKLCASLTKQQTIADIVEHPLIFHRPLDYDEIAVVLSIHAKYLNTLIQST